MRLSVKARWLTAVVILTNVLGNLALSIGMKAASLSLAMPKVVWLKALLNPALLTGVLLLILWMLSRLALLSWADLSYVLPVTSIGYVLSAVAGRLVLHEAVSPYRWAGALLILAGAYLVSRALPRSRTP
jgi:drug/metabolite transporter (DMT)-like permease